MVVTLQIKIFHESTFISPWKADTLFGHLCWWIAQNEGDSVLQDFLAPFLDNDPPFLISDGFPGDCLPIPLSAPFAFRDEESRFEKRKLLKQREYLSRADFDRVRRLEEPLLEPPEFTFRRTLSPHARISRLTNTTGEDSLFALEEFAVAGTSAEIPYISVYLRATDESWGQRVVAAIKGMSEFGGYGAKKSIGKGQFSVVGVEPMEFNVPDDADGFVSLSSFCPSESDPVEGLYKIFVKYGKLGGDFTHCGNPFKKPLVMLKHGSVFYTAGEPKGKYGRIVRDIAPHMREHSGIDVVQYAYAFPLPIRYPKEALTVSNIVS